jgi:hypothetical protein
MTGATQTFMKRLNWKSSVKCSLLHKIKDWKRRRQMAASRKLTMVIHGQQNIVGSSIERTLLLKDICLSISL